MLQKILGKDPDEAFQYQTERILIIRDIWLALIGYFFSILVIVYIVLYVFLILEKYTQQGTWDGYVFYRMTGKAYSLSDGEMEVWDHGDLLYPEQDSKGLMLGIYLREIEGQEIGYCLITCLSDSDCPAIPPKSYGNCMDNGYCDASSWCPNMDVNRTETIDTDILGVENFVLELWAGIQYPQFDSPEYISYSDGTPAVYPKDGASLFVLKDILKEAGIKDIQEIKETGAIIMMNFNWKCDASAPTCDPELKIERHDSEELNTTYK